MQATADGEFYPEKSLDKNFKIPRKDMPGETNTSVGWDSHQKANHIKTPLANSYYNYPYDPKAASSYYQFYQGYGNMSGQGSQQRGSFNFNAPPPPPPPSDGVEPIKQNIYNTLKDFKEKPKVYGKNIYDGNGGNFDDQGYGNKGSNSRGFSNQREFGNHQTFNPEESGNQLFSRERYSDDSNSKYGSGRRYDTERLDEDGNFYLDRKSNSSQDYIQASHMRGSNQGNDHGFHIQRCGSQEYGNDYNSADYDRGYDNEKGNNLVFDHDFNNPKRDGESYDFNRNSQRYVRDYNNHMHTNQSCDQDYNIGKRGGPNYDRDGNRQRYDQRRNNWGRNHNNRNERYNRNFGKDRFNRQEKEMLEKRPAYYELSVQQTVPDLLDESLPKDLKVMFQPLFCKLCSAQLSSNQAAKMHYKSKNHEKKIRKWLIEWSEKTGEPLHKRALATSNKKDEGAEKNPAWFHCDVCDLELTGQLHAESHYMGKNHQKALLGYKAPSGQGYYKDGKWVRVKGQKSKSYDFEKGEDNFGMDFKKAQEDAKEVDADSGEPPAKKKKESGPPSNFHCEICNVNATCQDQLDTHFRGQKHAKKLKQLGLENHVEHGKNVVSSGSTPVPVTPESPADVDMNLSVYRTPSGDYYCPTCNLTANSEPQFIQHMRSKGHAKKATLKKTKNSN